MTDKQAKFVDEYLVDLNATQAAIRAGYSERSARTAAARNMSNDNIAAAIAERQQEVKASTQVTQEMVVLGLLKEAEGKGDDTNANARISAWDKLGRHLGIYEQDNAQKVPPAVVIERVSRPPKPVQGGSHGD